MNYEKDMTIDHSALDVEWLNQPRLMFKYSEFSALKKAEADRAKEKVDYVKAELDKEIRENPKKFGVAKITEGVVMQTIILNEKYKIANDSYIDARFEQQVSQGAVAAIEQRKSALENMVKLYGQNYFAGPSIPRDLSKEWVESERQKEVDSKIVIKRRRQ